MNINWINSLQQLADDPSEFDHQGGTVVFVRRGKEVNLTLRERPGAGLCVMRNLSGLKDYVPVDVYLQRELLDLPTLAQQIQKSLDRLAQKRSARYIDAPARFEIDNVSLDSDEAKNQFKSLLCDVEPGVTNLIQLMAPAGHGKTVLLEEVAQSAAKEYQAEANPYPIVLLVDLLGRFVGNIDDAIAGAINNTYSFPSLSQKDVVVAMRNGWLTLALDGFDELVARIGPKDAFLRISDLLDQVDGAGNIIISARESFFELHRISIAIRSYLQPRRGSFKTSIVRLRPWTERQGLNVFKQLGSPNPETELSELRTAFADDVIAFQPFFLTRLAELWRKGERFGSTTNGSQLGRVRYVIDRLLDREVNEKWRDSKGNPILAKEDHQQVLQTIAEDMFRTGAYFLRADEVRIAAQVALGDKRIPSANLEAAIERFPTHAFMQSTERGYRFTHDKFMHYFLGSRLAFLCACKTEEFLRILTDKELVPEVVEWIVASLPENGSERISITKATAQKITTEAGAELRLNVGNLLPRILTGLDCSSVVVFKMLRFSGDSLRGLKLTGLVFSECSFATIDISQTEFQNCEFSRCEFDSIVVSEGTALTGSCLDGCTVGALNLAEKDRTFYSPREINERLILLGATLTTENSAPERVLADDIDEAVIDVVERLVKASNKGWDICVEEFTERYGRLGQQVIDYALECGVLRTWNRAVAGPRKHFVRFQIDRNRLLQALRESNIDPDLEKFWRGLPTK
jgi:hypothetical protein